VPLSITAEPTAPLTRVGSMSVPPGLSRLALRSFDQGHRHAVLDRAPRVHRLDLRQELRPEAGGETREADERRLADGVDRSSS
jgi:hypothetical protein